MTSVHVRPIIVVATTIVAAVVVTATGVATVVTTATMRDGTSIIVAASTLVLTPLASWRGVGREAVSLGCCNLRLGFVGPCQLGVLLQLVAGELAPP